MKDRAVFVLGFLPVHPGRGEPSRVELNIVLDYIKGRPVVPVVIGRKQALLLLEQLAAAIRIVHLTEDT